MLRKSTKNALFFLKQLCFHIKQESTNDELAWLQEIKKAHGSVEVTSLMQAEAINDCGIYMIGKNTGEYKVITMVKIVKFKGTDAIFNLFQCFTLL